MAGQSVTDLGLPVEDGRVVVKSVKAPAVKTVKRSNTDLFEVRLTSGFPRADRVKWENIHFQKAALDHVGLYSSTITHCVFDRCDLGDMGFWDCKVEGCLFTGCSLRGSALGGVDLQNPKPNT